MHNIFISHLQKFFDLRGNILSFVHLFIQFSKIMIQLFKVPFLVVPICTAITVK